MFWPTVFIRLWGFWKVPLIFWVCPKVISKDRNHAEVSIPLRRFTKNHVDSMYISVLVTGADIAGGLLVFDASKESNSKVSLIFKDLKASFLKRAEGTTHFRCSDGQKIRDLVKRTQESGQRCNETVRVIVTCPEKSGDDVVAEFELTLSVKKKS